MELLVVICLPLFAFGVARGRRDGAPVVFLSIYLLLGTLALVPFIQSFYIDTSGGTLPGLQEWLLYLVGAMGLATVGATFLSYGAGFLIGRFWPRLSRAPSTS